MPPNTSTPKPRVFSYPQAQSRLDPDAVKVLRRLTRYGHQAYLVGGCVRDLLLGREPKDFDVATSARPWEVRGLFRNCRVIGRRFRLAHVLFPGGKVIEVATFRRDPIGTNDSDEGTERHEESDLLIRQDNTFGEPHEDAARRDFTMNALFYDVERSEVLDYVGGLAEVERRVLRTIGEPDVRFREDPVRILRAIKFCARLDLGLDPDVYDAMVAHREDLLRAARPRLLEELLRLLRGGASRRSLWLAWETGTLSVLLPELSAFLDDDSKGRALLWRRLEAVDALVGKGELPADAVLLAALLLDPMEELMEGEADPTTVAGELLAELSERLALPRRMADTMRQALGVQKRLRQGRVGALSRRDYYPEAAGLCALELTARGAPAEDIKAVLQGRDFSNRTRPQKNATPTDENG